VKLSEVGEDKVSCNFVLLVASRPYFVYSTNSNCIRNF